MVLTRKNGLENSKFYRRRL